MWYMIGSLFTQGLIWLYNFNLMAISLDITK